MAAKQFLQPIDVSRLSADFNRLRHALVCRYNLHPDAQRVMARLDPSKPLHITWCGFLADHDGYDVEEAYYRQRVLEDRIAAVDPITGCMMPDRSPDHCGYSEIGFRGRRYHNAARITCAAVHGPMVRKMVTRHAATCIGRDCINPAHLKPGSQKKNMGDGVDRTNRVVTSQGRCWADERRIKKWARKALAAGVADVLQLPEAHRLPAPIIAKINAKLAA